jgi:hypothetical protein
MGLRDAIRALLDSEGDEQDTTGEIDEIEQGVADAASGDEGDGDEGDGDEGDGEGDEGAADDLGDDEGDEGDEGDGGEGTLGDETQSAEDADLRAQLIAQAEQIETLRNRLAAAGLDDSIAESVDEIEGDTLNDESEDLTVQAFEDDYAKRQAALAELKG